MLRHTGETSSVMVVSTVVVRMGEGAYGDGLPVSGLAIDGRTDEVSATDCGVRAEMVVSTAVVRMGEGARERERESGQGSPGTMR